VLVIESDESAREVARDVLARAEIRVVCSDGARRGIELLAARSRDVRLVLLDDSLPPTQVDAVIDSIRSLSPDARVLLSRRAGGDRPAQDAGARGASGYLEKPFAPQLLLASVRQALGD
jgi:DNA-binding NtrC family response regulator